MWMESAGEDQKPPARRRQVRTAVKRKSIDGKTEDKTKRKRTFEDFFNFCNFVLAYEQQLATTNGLIGTNSAGESSPSTSSPSPSHSSTSTNTSESLEGSAHSADEEEEEREGRGVEDNGTTLGPLSPASQNTHDEKLEYTSDDESWNLVTCFCHRPFAGRPMIECSECQTWIHLFCAKIKKNEVPEVYVCPKCRAASTRKAKRRKLKTKQTGNAPSS